MFDRKFQDERLFFVAGSAWHHSLPTGQTRSDNDVGQSPDYLQGLEQGENHWAYVSDLTSESKGNLPIICDGFSATPGVYASDHEKIGGTWKGKTAIVFRVDGSSKFERPGKGLRIYERVNGREVDIFSEEFGTPTKNIHNPL